MKSHGMLERAGHFAFLLMCLSVTAAAVQYVAVGRSSNVAEAKPPVRPGTVLERLARVSEPVQATVVLALSTECRFCTESVPFYRRLQELDEVKSGRVAILVASIQTTERMKSYLAANQLGELPVMAALETGLRVSGTPAIVIVDKVGRVVQSWAGLQSSDGEAAVVEALKTIGN